MVDNFIYEVMLDDKQRLAIDLNPGFMCYLLGSQMGIVPYTVSEISRMFKSEVKLRSDMNICRNCVSQIYNVCIQKPAIYHEKLMEVKSTATGNYFDDVRMHGIPLVYWKLSLDDVGLSKEIFEENRLTDLYQSLYIFLKTYNSKIKVKV